MTNLHTTDTPKCSRMVWVGFDSHQCTRNAVMEHDGKPLCRQHDPKAAEERKAKAKVRRRADRAAHRKRVLRGCSDFELLEEVSGRDLPTKVDNRIERALATIRDFAEETAENPDQEPEQVQWWDLINEVEETLREERA